MRHSFHNICCRLQHIFGYVQTVCKIIGASCRYVTHRHQLVALHNAGYHFIQRSIPAAADQEIVLFGLLRRHSHSISRILRWINGDLISGLYKDINNITEIILICPLPALDYK